MGKIKNVDSKKQDYQAVPANPFLRINLFPGFVATQETKDYVEARLAELRHPRKAVNAANSDDE